MSVALELRAMFSQEQLRELDAVSAAMRANPEVLDNHNRPSPVNPKRRKQMPKNCGGKSNGKMPKGNYPKQPPMRGSKPKGK